MNTYLKLVFFVAINLIVNIFTVDAQMTIDRELKLTKEDVNRQSSIDPRKLDLKRIYKVSKPTALMPEHTPKDPLEALKKVKVIPKDGQFQVIGVYLKKNIPWYQVIARDSGNKEIGKGWINSNALLGQNLRISK